MDENFTRLSNDILEALSRTGLTQYEWRFLMCLFRKTYGHQKKEDWIAPSQIVLMTGIHKAHVSRSLRLLKLRNIVTQRGNQIGFNKYHTQWKQLPNGVTNHELPNGVTSVTQRGTIVTQRGISELPNGADTKETITKETIQKKVATKVAILSNLKEDLQPIAIFLLCCGVVFDSYEQLQATIPRYIRTSKRLRPFSPDQLVFAYRLASEKQKKSGDGYTIHLETVEKCMIEVSALNPRGESKAWIDHIVSRFHSEKDTLLTRASSLISQPSI